MDEIKEKENGISPEADAVQEPAADAVQEPAADAVQEPAEDTAADTPQELPFERPEDRQEPYEPRPLGFRIFALVLAILVIIGLVLYYYHIWIGR